MPFDVVLCVRLALALHGWVCSMLLQRARGMQPDVRTYTSLMICCSFAKDEVTARALVSLLDCCCSQDRLSQHKHCFRHMTG